jgi:UrcA family protein
LTNGKAVASAFGEWNGKDPAVFCNQRIISITKGTTKIFPGRREMRQSNASLALIAALVTAAGIGVAGPGVTQTSVEEITVTGHYGPAPDSVRSLSQTVSYDDLDLSTDAGRHALHHRISLTARFLCDKLGESDTGDTIAPSCRDAAEKDAMNRVETVEAGFAPRGTTWVAGPPWSPPYTTDWAGHYPDE